MGVGERAQARTAGVTGNSAQALGKTLKTNPSDTRALLRFAELEAKAGRAAAACEAFVRVAEIFGKQGFARRALSSFAQALVVARGAGLGGRVLPIARAMGKLYLTEQLRADALTTLDDAASWLIERGYDASALPLLEDRIAIEDSELALVRLGETYFRLRELSKGADALAAAFHRLHPQGRWDEALDVAERLLKEQRDVEVARTAAELYLARNRPGDPILALAKLRICCEADPSHRPTLELLAKAFDLAGHHEKGARVWRELGVLQRPKTLPSRPIGAAPARPRSSEAPPARPRSSEAPPARPRSSEAPPRLSAIPPRQSVLPPCTSAIRPKAMPAEAPASEASETSEAKEDSIECTWDDLLVECSAQPIDGNRSAPLQVGDAPSSSGPVPERSGSIISVSLSDVELVDEEAATPPSESARSASRLEAALDRIEGLLAAERYEEAALLVARHLALRPNNPLLLERKLELEQLLSEPRPGAGGARAAV